MTAGRATRNRAAALVTGGGTTSPPMLAWRLPAALSLREPMEKPCDCELCGGYTERDQTTAFAKLSGALSLLRDSVDLGAAEREEVDRAEVVALDAGLNHPVPAVVFEPPSRLETLKAAFTYGYLLASAPEDIAKSIHESIVGELSE